MRQQEGRPSIPRRFAIACVVATLGVLAMSSTALAGHEHPGAPCWSNGMGAGDNNDGYFHPYVHYAGCYGPNPFLQEIIVSTYKYFGDNHRVHRGTCSLCKNRHYDVGTRSAECGFWVNLYVSNEVATHGHAHHSDCRVWPPGVSPASDWWVTEL